MKNIIIFIVLIAILQGCATPFSTFYHDKTGGLDITQIPYIIVTNEDPKLIQGSDDEMDSMKMLEDGYVLIGYSLFNSGDVNISDAIDQAKTVKAAVVFVYSKHTNTESGVLPLTRPNKQTSMTNIQGNIYGPGGFATYSGNTSTTTYGTKTTYVPYTVNKSDYLATYWAKRKPPIFGAYLVDLTDDDRRKISSNKGMRITAVIKNSPAFFSDIFRGDIIKQIGEVEVYNEEKYKEALEKYRGKTVDFTVFQDNKEIVKTTTFNN